MARYGRYHLGIGGVPVLRRHSILGRAKVKTLRGAVDCRLAREENYPTGAKSQISIRRHQPRSASGAPRRIPPADPGMMLGPGGRLWSDGPIGNLPYRCEKPNLHTETSTPISVRRSSTNSTSRSRDDAWPRRTIMVRRADGMPRL